MQQQTANRVGRAASVIEQLSAVGIGGCIARFFNLLNEGAEQIIQQRHGQLVQLNILLQRAKDGHPSRLGRLPLCNGMQLCAV